MSDETSIRNALLREGLKAHKRSKQGNARFTKVAEDLGVDKREVTRIRRIMSGKGLLVIIATDLYQLTDRGVMEAEVEAETVENDD
jgi:Mn-dependent DtxR family transcriptional regulator